MYVHMPGYNIMRADLVASAFERFRLKLRSLHGHGSADEKQRDPRVLRVLATWTPKVCRRMGFYNFKALILTLLLGV